MRRAKTNKKFHKPNLKARIDTVLNEEWFTAYSLNPLNLFQHTKNICLKKELNVKTIYMIPHCM